MPPKKSAVEEAGLGHNSIAKKDLLAFITRVEKLVEDRKAVSEDIREMFTKIKGSGFDTRTVKEMIKLRAMDTEKRNEQEELRDLYLMACGLA